MAFEVIDRNIFFLIRVDGNIDLYMAPDFKLKIRDYLAQINKKDAKKPVIIDFSMVDYIDSPGIGALMDLKKMFVQKGIRYGYINVSPDIYRMFEVTKLQEYFPVFANEKLALGNLLKKGNK
jgi:anti-anti-sigma factor